MENLSNRDINTLRHTKFPVLVGRNFNGVVWELWAAPGVMDGRRLLHDFILDLLYKTKDVIVIRDSENVLGFVFMVAENAVSPIDLLEPEIAGQVQTRKLTIKMYPKETSMGQEADEEW